MRLRYFEWDDDLQARLLAEQGLMRLFNHLLLQTNGDVEEALDWMAYLQQRGYLQGADLEVFKQRLEQEEIVQRQGPQRTLTPKGEKWIREESLNFSFESLKASGSGNHPLAREGEAVGELLRERRAFAFGDDPAHIDYQESFKNTVQRSGLGDMRLSEPDLVVQETEAGTAAATVLLLDISHSMVLYGEDRITPAKQVAMALAQMIQTRYPKDSLEVVVFGDEAWRIDIKDLAYMGVGPYHTNTQEGLQVARDLLMRQKTTNRQIFMITDGKPSVVRRRNGELYINSFGLDPYIVNRTLDEAMICRKRGVAITTFMIASDPYLQQFVRRLTELNQGRAYFAPVGQLGGFIFRDFMGNRSRRAR